MLVQLALWVCGARDIGWLAVTIFAMDM